MAVYFVTGKLGSGKTLAAVGRMRDYLIKGSRIAGNLDLDLTKLCNNPKSRKLYTRIPDKPRLSDLQALGLGSESPLEETYGALVLDECGTWFNSRNWNDKGRKPIIDWFLHARKLGWDVFFVVQDICQIDSQARAALCEHLVVCKRLDRLPVPGLRLLGQLFGFRLTLPKVHVANVYYGDNAQSALKVDRWVYQGHELYEAYDTRQVFTDGFEQLSEGADPVDMRATYTQLPPYIENGYAYVANVLAILKARGADTPPKPRGLLQKGFLTLYNGGLSMTSGQDTDNGSPTRKVIDEPTANYKPAALKV